MMGTTVHFSVDSGEVRITLAGHRVDREHIVIDVYDGAERKWVPLLPSEFRHLYERVGSDEGFGDRCFCCGRLLAAPVRHQGDAGSTPGGAALPEPHLSGVREAFEALKATIVELRAELQRLERGSHGD
jgi:hypothetical protein